VSLRRFAWIVSSALFAASAIAQELEPRAYSNAPVGTSFAIASYTRLSGDVLPDPSLPVKNVDATIDGLALGYAHFFALLGRSANFSAALPYVSGDLKGDVVDSPTEVHRAGIGDLRLRGAINLFGLAAMTPAEFVRQPDRLSGGASLSVIAPTGQYDDTRFVNIGTNRWAAKPELGLSYPIGKWFTEASAGVWVFGDNDDFRGGHTRSQDPLQVYQIHAGYNFRPGFWLAADYGRYIGGRTSVDGVANDDAQKNSRIGLVLSLPVAPGWSTKLGWSKGTVVRAGGDYKIFSLALQYRWFD
jgi:hypothetical protein